MTNPLSDDKDRAGGPAEHAAPQQGSRPAPPRSRRFFGNLFRGSSQSTASKLADAQRDAARQAIDLCHALLSERGEVSGARLASQVLAAYQSFDPSALGIFFDRLVEEFSPDRLEVERATNAYAANASQWNLILLQSAVEPPRQELFRRLNMAPGAMAVLIQMRGKLMKTLSEHPERIGLDADLAHLFRSWFNRGFLTLQRIDWRTSALVLERLIEYEAVHQIQGWQDLRRRLAPDRRCYAFFHPALPDEPLIFIEVALTRGLAAHIQPLLNPGAEVLNPAEANCAIFYSITNCQEGLRGVSFGHFLIKQVAEDLGREFPRLRWFATLSPIPGFTAWLKKDGDPAAPRQMTPKLAQLLEEIERTDPLDPNKIGEGMRDEISALCAHYLAHAKQGKEPLDPVARFHLANGARLERLNWMGDISQTALRRSLGLMANYVYRLADVERNHEAYAKEYRITVSSDFERFLRQLKRRGAGK